MTKRLIFNPFYDGQIDSNINDNEDGVGQTELFLFKLYNIQLESRFIGGVTAHVKVRGWNEPQLQSIVLRNVQSV